MVEMAIPVHVRQTDLADFAQHYLTNGKLVIRDILQLDSRTL